MTHSTAASNRPFTPKAVKFTGKCGCWWSHGALLRCQRCVPGKFPDDDSCPTSYEEMWQWSLVSQGKQYVWGRKISLCSMVSTQGNNKQETKRNRTEPSVWSSFLHCLCFSSDQNVRFLYDPSVHSWRWRWSHSYNHREPSPRYHASKKNSAVWKCICFDFPIMEWTLLDPVHDYSKGQPSDASGLLPEPAGKPGKAGPGRASGNIGLFVLWVICEEMGWSIF